MKVIDLQAYRVKKQIESLQKQVGEIAFSQKHDAAKMIKTCFKEWIAKTMN